MNYWVSAQSHKGILAFKQEWCKLGRQYMTILGEQSSKFSIWGDSCTSSSLLRLTNKPGRLWSSSCRRRVRRSSRGSTTGGWSTLLYFQSPELHNALCLLICFLIGSKVGIAKSWKLGRQSSRLVKGWSWSCVCHLSKSSMLIVCWSQRLAHHKYGNNFDKNLNISAPLLYLNQNCVRWRSKKSG